MHVCLHFLSLDLPKTFQLYLVCAAEKLKLNYGTNYIFAVYIQLITVQSLLNITSTLNINGVTQNG